VRLIQHDELRKGSPVEGGTPTTANKEVVPCSRAGNSPHTIACITPIALPGHTGRAFLFILTP